ncbi:CRISPR-associated helicase Cas3' [Nocardia vulneris]|uniref:CRISPR-associated helicase Cas3' n=1 Tax=Nocardia vulneris TaxID=1141657 RepID=UPI0030D1DCC9
MLSAATCSAWAKSDPAGGCLSLVQHLADSAAVAGLVWDRWLPDRTKELIAAGLPGGLGDGKVLVRWLAGVHDIGKLSPAFACQVPELADVMYAEGLVMRGIPANRKALPHGLAGQVALEQFLLAQGWTSKVAQTYSIVVGSHHGTPPTRHESRDAPNQEELLGAQEWERCRNELLDYVTDSVGARQRLADWQHIPLPLSIQVLLTAAVIVSDWIASNQDLFPLDSRRRCETAAIQAWERLNLPGPWQPTTGPCGEELFRQRFDLPGDVLIRPLQSECLRLAEGLDRPGLMIVEAPMGEGKTEAALLTAEVLARRFGLGGVFVALPTMATSDAMFGRVHEWVRKLPDTAGSVFLAHGKAALNPTFAAMRRKGFQSIGIDCGDDGIIAHAWYVGKKGPLANIVVGTIDQILRGALKTRHVMLRHLALANKVVVIDEVHAADSYMSTYLCRCLEWLGAYGVPVVLMSATLPPLQRQSLLDAYRRGATDGTSAEPITSPTSYPRVTVWPGDTEPVAVPASGRSVEVEFEYIDDDLTGLITQLDGVVGIVCNTVARAQQTYTALLESTLFEPEQLLLLHSRFVSVHRATLENRLRSLLGPPGKAHRPDRFVVIGTQVIEQSLDIDVDLLITDLAPIDLLLQRIGRLHRHHRPDRTQAPRCLIRAADWSGPIPIPDKGAAAVYRPARLLRAAAVLGRLPDKHIRIPAQIPSLVADGYSDTFVPPEDWTEAFAAAEADWQKYTTNQQERAEAYLLGRPYGGKTTMRGWLSAAAPDTEGVGGQAQVRDAEDTIEAIVVRRDGDNIYTLRDLPDYRDRLIPTEGPPSSGLAKALASCTIRLPATLTNYGRMHTIINTLEQNHYPGWQQSPWLAGELVLELDATSTATLAGHNLRYDHDLGLLIDRIDPNSSE